MVNENRKIPITPNMENRPYSLIALTGETVSEPMPTAVVIVVNRHGMPTSSTDFKIDDRLSFPALKWIWYSLIKCTLVATPIAISKDGII